jgi:microcystin-dependent protein
MVGRCGCASDDCRCTIVAGDGITIAGTGSAGNPYVVSQEAPSIGGGGGERLTGEMVLYAGTVYADLYAVLGIAAGSGDGATTFNVPDWRDRVPMGASSDKPRGTTGGQSKLTTANLPAHTHSINHDHAAANTSAAGLHDHATYHNDIEGGASASTFDEGWSTGRTLDNSLVQSAGSHSHSVDLPSYTGVSGSTGQATPADFLPPWGAYNWIIKS